MVGDYSTVAFSHLKAIVMNKDKTKIKSTLAVSSNDAASVSSIATSPPREVKIYLEFLSEKKTKQLKSGKSSKSNQSCPKNNRVLASKEPSITREAQPASQEEERKEHENYVPHAQAKQSKRQKLSEADQAALSNNQALTNKGPVIIENEQPVNQEVDLKEYEMYVEHKRAEASKRQKLNEAGQAASSNDQALANKDPAITAKAQPAGQEQQPFFKKISDAIGLYSELENQKKQLQKDYDKLCEVHENLLLKYNASQASCTELTKNNNQLTLSNQALEAKVEGLKQSEKALKDQIKQLEQDSIKDTNQLLTFMDNSVQYKEKPAPDLNLQSANAMQNHFGQSQPVLTGYYANPAPNTISIQSQPMYAMPNAYAPYSYPITSSMPSLFYQPHSAQSYNPQMMQHSGGFPHHFPSQASQSQPSFVSYHNPPKANVLTTQSQSILESTSLGHVPYSRPPTPMSTLPLSSFSPLSMAFNDTGSVFNLPLLHETSLSST